MRAYAPHKWSKVHPPTLIGEEFKGKKLQFTAWANAFQWKSHNGVGDTNSSTTDKQRNRLGIVSLLRR